MSPQAATKRKELMVEIQNCDFLSPELAKKVNDSFSENALRMMKKRYLVRREDGTQETPAEMIHRIAHAVAAAETNYSTKPDEIRAWEKEFFDILAEKEFTPAGRTITNAGAPSLV